jgi:uncharacterized damage-inducible protein DinB
MRSIPKPRPGEYPAYAEMYMSLLPDDGRILEHLRMNVGVAREFILSLPSEKLLYRYAPDKWSIKEILVHIVDDERIYAYRALRFARNERQGLVGFDQDEYARYSQADDRDLDNIFEEYDAVRAATIALFDGLPNDSLTRMGVGSGTAGSATVRAMAYHIAGHELHHLNIIKARYL